MLLYYIESNQHILYSITLYSTLLQSVYYIIFLKAALEAEVQRLTAYNNYTRATLRTSVMILQQVCYI